MLDAAHVAFVRPARVHVEPGVVVVGETVAGSGRAGIVAHADRLLGLSDAASA